MLSKEEQVVQYIDGYAWGVAPDGRTICLGTETTVKRYAFHRYPYPKRFSPVAIEVIDLERELQLKAITQRIRDKEKEERASEKKHGRRINKRGTSENFHVKRGRCPICVLATSNSVHHIKPLEKGGSEAKSNKVKVCKSCHDILEEFAGKDQYYSPQLAILIRLGF